MIYSYACKLNEDKIPYLVREKKFNVPKLTRYNNPDTIVEFIHDQLELDQYAEERLWVLCFDAKMHMTGCFEASHGAATQTIMDVRSICQKALILGAISIILVHNHPSGDPTPSTEDVKATKQINKATEMIGIGLLDHVIISDATYYSMNVHKLF